MMPLEMIEPTEPTSYNIMEEMLENIVAYATKSPENTNPNVLRSMLMEFAFVTYDAIIEEVNNNNNGGNGGNGGNEAIPK